MWILYLTIVRTIVRFWDGCFEKTDFQVYVKTRSLLFSTVTVRMRSRVCSGCRMYEAIIPLGRVMSDYKQCSHITLKPLPPKCPFPNVRCNRMTFASIDGPARIRKQPEAAKDLTYR